MILPASIDIPLQQRILVDGQEGTEGRALLTISALHLCTTALRGCSVDVLYCDNPSVAVAAAVLAAETQSQVTCYRPDDSAPRWPGARLYLSTRFRFVDDDACRLAEEHHVTPLVTLQFPLPSLFGLQVMRRVRAAHDPKLLARMIETFLGQGTDDGA